MNFRHNLTRHNKLEIKKQLILALLLYSLYSFIDDPTLKLAIMVAANYTWINISTEVYFNERTHNNMSGFQLMDIPFMLGVFILYIYVTAKWATALFTT